MRAGAWEGKRGYKPHSLISWHKGPPNPDIHEHSPVFDKNISSGKDEKS